MAAWIGSGWFPLIFAGLAVSAAYLLGRELGLTRFTAGLLTAAAALLSADDARAQ